MDTIKQGGLPQDIQYVLNSLKSAGYSAYVVGGSVRDTLMGKTPDDYDVTTSAKPEEIARVFKNDRVVETGLKHGTLTVVLGEYSVEVTTYRIDGEYHDGRHPDSVTFSDRLDEDLCRRDFTINAMAYSDDEGLVDLWSGREDIENRRIRCVGCAADRFREDGLRILRAVRFASTLDFAPDTECDEAVRTGRELLKNVSRERIYAELSKLICGPAASRVLFAYPEVISYVLPPLTEAEVRYSAWAVNRDEEFSRSAKLTFGEKDAEVVLRYALLLGINKNARGIMNSLKPSRAMETAVGAIIKIAEKNLTTRSPLFGVTPTEYAAKQILASAAVFPADVFACLAVRYLHALHRLSAASAARLADTARSLYESGAVYSLDRLGVDGNVLRERGFTGAEIGRELSRLLDAAMRGEKIT